MKAGKGHGRTACTIAALLMLGGCSSGSGLFGKSDSGTAHDFGLTRDWNLLAGDQARVRAVQPSDLVGPDGHCAEETAAPSAALKFQAGPDASRGDTSAARPETPAGPLPRGIGLGMTECEVVRAAGHMDKVEISANERGGRQVALTYLRGNHVDIYQFEDGRLKSIQRAPQAQAADVPAKPRRNGTQAVGN